LLQSVKPHARIVGRERSIFEYGIIEEISRRHRHLHAVIVESLFEFAHDAITYLRRRIDRYEIVVMKIDAVSAESAQLFHHLERTQTWARRIAKRIAPAIADSPKSESEFVFRSWLVIVTRHLVPSLQSPVPLRPSRLCG